MATDMWDHPERGADEVFLGNFPRKEDLRKCFQHLKTIRRGNQAYSIDRTTAGMGGLSPVFIGKREEPEYNRIYLDEMR